MAMNLYLISQTENRDYDTFDAAIVAAKSEDAARHVRPSGDWSGPDHYWCKTPEAVSVKLIGIAAPGVDAGTVLASFNAG